MNSSESAVPRAASVAGESEASRAHSKISSARDSEITHTLGLFPPVSALTSPGIPTESCERVSGDYTAIRLYLMNVPVGSGPLPLGLGPLVNSHGVRSPVEIPDERFRNGVSSSGFGGVVVLCLLAPCSR